jgi:hypothetical protein
MRTKILATNPLKIIQDRLDELIDNCRALRKIDNVNQDLLHESIMAFIKARNYILEGIDYLANTNKTEEKL